MTSTSHHLRPFARWLGVGCCACVWLTLLGVANPGRVVFGNLASGNIASAAESAILPAVAAELKPAYWRQKIFLIPYQLNAASPLADQVDKVRLLISQQSTGNWSTLQEAEPNVRGFSYHAPQDGDYWFAVQMVDRRGNAWPTGTIKPQLRIVVDTEQPQLELTAASDALGRAILSYSASDANLMAESLAVEAQVGEVWSQVQLTPPDVAQPDRIVGRVLWTPPTGGGPIRWRALIADRAGNRTTATAEGTAPTAHDHPLAPMPAVTANSDQEPFGPSLEWPASNAAPSHRPLPQMRASNQPPPLQNPYANLQGGNRAAGRDDHRVAAQFAADRPPAVAAQPSLSPSSASPVTPPNDAASQMLADAGDDWSAVGDPSEQASDRLVNSATFEVEYDLQAVGRWGVAKVALWGTRDGGQTWTSYATDDDNRSPIRVTVPTGGTYGFRLLVDGANGAAAPPPRAGESPELTVTVDLHKPSAELIAAEIGQGHLADHLLVRWSAVDTNLESRPIGLFYAAYAEGPWSTIATDLANSGQYAWRLERHVPERFYLRLEVRDVAGNVTAASTPTPVTLERPKPMGRLRDVRPVSTDSSQPRAIFHAPPIVQPLDQTARAPSAAANSATGR